MNIDLSKVAKREALVPTSNGKVYWQRLRPGCFVGYRPSAKGGAGSWCARAYDDERKGYREKPLGSYAEQIASERFAEAKLAAEQFAAEVERGGVVEVEERVETVGEACRKFALTHNEAPARFERFVYGDPIAKVKLAKLRRSHTDAWRKRLEATPAKVSRNKVGEFLTRPRSLATVNRDMAVFRTALSRFAALGAPNSEAAWQEPLKPIPNAVTPRDIYLTRQQRKAVLDNISDEGAPFVRALCLLPLRPGPVAVLTAASYDKRSRVLSIGKDKGHKPRKVVLPVEAAALFAEAVKDKLPTAPLFTQADGRAWDKNTWNDPIKDAVKAANKTLPKAAKLPAGVTAYTFRHSTITDLVLAKVPLLTIAQIAGTSVKMIEQFYGHLNNDTATEGLASLAL
jgi:integrase